MLTVYCTPHTFVVNVQAYFQSIPAIIATQLLAATQSVQVAVAWFTDKQLLDTLCQQAKAGLTVELMVANDSINHRYGADYELLTQSGGRVYIVGIRGSDTLMHNKFAIIDLKHTITGSYNWSYRAQQNHENITITTDAPELALQYYQEFSRLKTRYAAPASQQPDVDMAQLMTRFEVILGLVRLGDYAQAQLQLDFFRGLSVPAEVLEIINQFEQTNYAEAARLIGYFRTAHQRLVRYDDEEVFFLKLELKTLEQEVVAIENQKTDYQRIIDEYLRWYHIEFGELLLEKDRLLLRYEQIRGRVAPTQTKTAYEEFRENLWQQPVFHRPVLSEQDEQSLKKQYRKAVMLCHPDKVPKKHEITARQIFVRLTDAYQRNDTQTVASILQQLETGAWLSGNSLADTLTQREQLREAITNLRQLIATLKADIDAMLTNEHFDQIPDETEQEAFAATERLELQNDIDRLISKIIYHESQSR